MLPSLLAIDPGTEQSAWVVMRGLQLLRFGLAANSDMLIHVKNERLDEDTDEMAVEMVASYGMPVGCEVFQTVLWVGRFLERWEWSSGRTPTMVYRREVKMALCGRATAKDANIRQAVLDLYPATGGGKIPQIGTKAQPGPLYGVSRDVWAALAVGIAYQIQRGRLAWAGGRLVEQGAAA